MNEQSTRKLYALLGHALAWLENVAANVGDEALVDASPNNFGGRVAIREALAEAEAAHPEWTDYPPGTYVRLDTGPYGFVERRGTISVGRRGIPAYLVDIGRETVPIPIGQVRRVTW